jgi:hypothetical protein
MAFDQKTRNLLQRTITACRRVFDREFTAQLQEFYGIQPDGTLTQCEMLDHLADEELEVARLLRSRLNHLEGGEPSEALTRTEAKPENVARVIREQAFTVLNRLAALRLCEERGLVLECVRQGVNSEGFQLFMTTAGNALGETYEAYLVFLHCLFDELALDLGVLFDRFSPLALLFPRKDALEEVLRELNGTGKAAENEAISAEQFAEIWKADETIGWIYQYYNDEAERKKMREESSAPRNSRELAIRNQFFTPRYVVEFLTDNTLGRLWYEMRHGETALRDQCHYLVRRPTEIFLKPGEAAPESSAGNEASQEELLGRPVHIPHRPLKDPREIRLLDPACGSMHFGLYAFDLLTVIYDEAWEIAHGPDEVAKSTEIFAPFVAFVANFSDKAAYLLQVPRLIVEHNIHGIDIDPRAAQIAGLSLWLRAQRAWHEAGIQPADRPQITRSNIVCAEAMPGEKKLLREFVEEQFDIGERPAFAYLLEKIFDRMALAGEAGSLLRIEDEIRSAIAEAHTLARTQSAPKQVGLFPEDEEPAPEQLDLKGLLDEHFWRRAEQRIYDALEAYAEQAENGGGFQRRLFADDAAKGFAFIDLCRKFYDVVVMNPPFGSPSLIAEKYLSNAYPDARYESYGQFLIRAMAMAEFVGALTSRGFLFLANYKGIREAVVPQLSIFLDLGAGILDGAFVEVCASVLNKATCESVVCLDDRSGGLRSFPNGDATLFPATRIFLKKYTEYLDQSPFCYDTDPTILALFQSGYTLEKALGGLARVGLATGDNERFIRCHWEVPASGINDRWRWHAKGGEYLPFKSDVHLVVDWTNDGKPIEDSFAGARIHKTDVYFRPAVTYSRRSLKGLSFRALPENCICGEKGPVLISPGNEYALLALANSSLFKHLVSIQSAASAFEIGAIQRVPLPSPFDAVRMPLTRFARDISSIYAETSCLDETDTGFFWSGIWRTSQSLGEIGRLVNEWLEKSRRRVDTLLRQLDSLISDAYRVTAAVFPSNDYQTMEEAFFVEDQERKLVRLLVSFLVGCVFGRWDVRFATRERLAPELPEPFAPLPICSPGMFQGEDGLPRSPEAGRRLREEGLYPLDVAWDGILVDDPEHPFDLERRVHFALAVLWAGNANTVEQEACGLLGVPTLREWFHRPASFFADHLTRFSKSRRQAPIYWPLSTSSGRYTLWLYYHRLTPDTLYKCLQQFVLPKLADLEKELEHLRTVLAANEGGLKERNRSGELEDLRQELIELRVELELWAPKWKPNLNDGVLITAAPLWKLFRLPKWQKDLKACWKELEKGDYDWSHLAYSLWPDRVREKCKADRSLAIAHGLEEICEVKAPVKKVKKTKKTATKDDLQEYFEG